MARNSPWKVLQIGRGLKGSRCSYAFARMSAGKEPAVFGEGHEERPIEETLSGGEHVSGSDFRVGVQPFVEKAVPDLGVRPVVVTENVRTPF